MHTINRTWRLRGLPLDIEEQQLKHSLERHPDLQCPSGSNSSNASSAGNNGLVLYSLATDACSEFLEATFRLCRLPPCLENLDKDSKLAIELSIEPVNSRTRSRSKRRRAECRNIKVFIDDVFDDITVLYSPSPGEHNVDILAVPGLGSHPFGSFMHKDDGHMWLKDKLPTQAPGARIMIFGYKSRLQDSTSFAELDTYIALFQEALSQLLSSSSRKPIILIGHSFGGLLIKGALINMFRPMFDAVNSVIGMLMFGVPNDGMNNESLVSIVADQHNRLLVEVLRPEKSALLKTLNRDFLRILQSLHIEIFCFFETSASPTAILTDTGQYKMLGPPQVFVTETSATHCLPESAPAECAIGLFRDHSNLVKFGHFDQDYKTVKRVVGQVLGRLLSSSHDSIHSQRAMHLIDAGSATQIRADNQYDEERDRCFRDLQWDDPDRDMRRIENTKGGLYKDVFCWILEHPQFHLWYENDTNVLLWIKGGAGKGKTMLMIGIIEHLRNIAATEPARRSFLAFFFCQNSDKRLNNAKAVIKGLIYRLLMEDSRLFLHMKRHYSPSGNRAFEGINAFSTLSAIFQEIIRHSKAETIYLVVDALDECDEGLSDLLRLISRTTAQCTRIKWILTSRIKDNIEHGALIGDSFMRLSLELNSSFVSQAVSIYIDHQINGMPSLRSAPALRDQVRKTLLAKSDGTFLWVALVCEKISGALGNEILRAIGQIPSGLMPLYDRMLEQIEKPYMMQCLAILSTATIAYQPMSLLELRMLSNMVDQPMDDFQRLIDKCGSFLTVIDDTVYFIHRSASDYLTDHARSKLFPLGLADAHYSVLSRSIGAMKAVLCHNIYGLQLCDEIPVAIPNPDPLATIRYACLYWISHFCELDKYDREKYDEVGVFITASFIYWLEALSLMQQLDMAVSSIVLLENYWRVHSSDLRWLYLIWDCRRFSIQFKSIIAKAPLQIYSSALIFSPTNSLVRQLFEDRDVEAYIKSRPKTDEFWSTCIHTIECFPYSPRASIAFSPNSKLIGLSLINGRASAWHTTTGTALYLPLPPLPSNTQTYEYPNILSPDLSHWAVAVSCERLEVWSVFRGEKVCMLHGNLRPIQFSHDSKLLATGRQDEDELIIWDLVTAAKISSVRVGGTILYSSFSHNLSLLYVEADDPSSQEFPASRDSSAASVTGRVMDTESGLRLYTLATHKKEGYLPHNIAIFGYKPDVMALHILGNKQLEILNARSGTQVRSISCPEGLNSAAFSPDSPLLALGTIEGRIEICNSESGLKLCTFDAHGVVNMMVFSQGSNFLASSSASKVLKVWDLTQELSQGQGEYEPRLQPEDIDDVLLSPCSRYLTFSTRSGTILRSMEETGIEQRFLTSRKVVAFSNDSKVLVSRSFFTGPQVLDRETGNEISMFKTSWNVQSVAISEDNEFLAVGLSDKTIEIWKVTPPSKIHTFSVHTISAEGMSFSRDSKYLVSSSADEIATHDLSTGALQMIWAKPRVYSRWSDNAYSLGISMTSVVFSHDSALIASSESTYYSDGQIHLWEATTGTLLRRLVSPFRSYLEKMQIRAVDNLFIYTSSGRIKLPPIGQDTAETTANEKVDYDGYSVTTSQDGDEVWVTWNGRRVLWIPPDQRPKRWSISYNTTSASHPHSSSSDVTFALITNSGESFGLVLSILGHL